MSTKISSPTRIPNLSRPPIRKICVSKVQWHVQQNKKRKLRNQITVQIRKQNNLFEDVRSSASASAMKLIDLVDRDVKRPV